MNFYEQFAYTVFHSSSYMYFYSPNQELHSIMIIFLQIFFLFLKVVVELRDSYHFLFFWFLVFLAVDFLGSQ